MSLKILSIKFLMLKEQIIFWQMRKIKWESLIKKTAWFNWVCCIRNLMLVFQSYAHHEYQTVSQTYEKKTQRSEYTHYQHVANLISNLWAYIIKFSTSRRLLLISSWISLLLTSADLVYRYLWVFIQDCLHIFSLFTAVASAVFFESLE